MMTLDTNWKRTLDPGSGHLMRDAGWDVPHFAAAFACVDAEATDQVIGSLVTQAFAERRLDDAKFWQRVKLHSRMVRVVPGWSDRAMTAMAAK